MDPFLDEDSKDGRQFPTDAESRILIQNLQLYFSHPERSVQRAQIVQNVVSILSPMNEHWTHRTVRLWFNNNKKVFFHQTSSSPPQSPPAEIRREAPRSFASPHKCFVPPRSHSVAVFPPSQGPPRSDDNRLFSAHPVHSFNFFCGPPDFDPPPKKRLFADQVRKEYDRLHRGDLSIIPQLESESRLTNKIVELHERDWNDLVSFQPARMTISSVPFMESSWRPPILRSCVNYKDSMIESSLIRDSTEPIIVSYDPDVNCQRLHFSDTAIDINLIQPVTSMAFDETTGLVWLNSSPLVCSFNLKENRIGQTVTTSTKRSPHTSMVFWEGNLAVASGSTIFSWSPKLLSDPTQQGGEVSLTLPFSPITSLTTVGDSLAAASTEHHNVHLYAPNGAPITQSIGHSLGIITLGKYTQSEFLSGSADQTVKLWDVRQQTAVINFKRHQGIVTTVFGVAEGNLVISGGTDGIVRGWDVRGVGRSLFAVSVGVSAPQTIHYALQHQLLTVVVSERVRDRFYDLEKFGMTFEQENQVDLPAAGVFTFQFALPV